MQMSAILGAMPGAIPVLAAETPLAMPVENAAWAALAATLAGDKPEVRLPEVETEEIVTPEPPIVMDLAPPPPTVLKLPLPDVAPLEAAPAAVELVEAAPRPMVLETLPTQPEPLDQPDPPPQFFAEQPVQILPQPGASPLPRRSKVEAFWEMQGLISPVAVAQESAPKAAPDAVPERIPDKTPPTAENPPDVPVEQTLARQDVVETAGPRNLAPDQPDNPMIAKPEPLPLLQASPPGGQTQALPKLTPEFRAALQAQAKAPADGGITLTLAPVELGELHLVMIPEGESLRVTITVERPETLDLLRRHADQLGQELRQAGFHSASFSFAQSGQDDRNPQPPAAHLATAPLQPETPTAPSPLASGGLDLRI
jgi:flagellar hook-length control protein FliK